MLPHPLAACERAHQLAIKAARILIVDVLNNAVLFQLGRTQPVVIGEN